MAIKVLGNHLSSTADRAALRSLRRGRLGCRDKPGAVKNPEADVNGRIFFLVLQIVRFLTRNSESHAAVSG